MDFLWYLFSFDGRINRAKFWLAALIILCWMIFLAILTVAGMVAIENFGLNNDTWGAGSSGALAVAPPRLFGVNLGPSGGFLGLHYGLPTPTFGPGCQHVPR